MFRVSLDRILDDIEIEYVTLTMPLFKFESQFSLGETLAGMGMPDAFGDRADLSGMTGTRELRISAIVHKAFVSVDEEGTEAAAATGRVCHAFTPRQRAYPGDGQPALHLPYPGYGHGHGPVPGPRDEPESVRDSDQT